MYSITAPGFTSGSAPIEISVSMPVRRSPTSVSSTLPLKMRFDISAILATVVPSFMVLAWITDEPTFTGTSRISPVMVALTRVLLCCALMLDIPSRTIDSASTAAAYSASAFLKATCDCSNSSRLTNFFSYSDLVRSYSFFACKRDISATSTRFWADDSCDSSGMTLIFAIMSPSFTWSPGSTFISEMIPEIWGFISISSRGSIVPVSTLLRSIDLISGLTVS